MLPETKYWFAVLVYLVTITGVIPAMNGYSLSGTTFLLYWLVALAYVARHALYYKEGTYWVHKTNGIVYLLKKWQEYIILDGSTGSRYDAKLIPVDDSKPFDSRPRSQNIKPFELRRDYNRLSKVEAEDLVEREKGLCALAELP